MQLADSVFPIGASSHSFGIETLAAEGVLRAPEIEAFLTDQLWENGQLEARFVRLAYRTATVTNDEATSEANDESREAYWLALNRTLGATKSARESRVASATLGRRFLQMAAHLAGDATLQHCYQVATSAVVEIHYAVAFGLVGGRLALGEEETVLAYLQQTTMGMLSACLRLLPIGQGRTSEILWRLGDLFIAVATASRTALPSMLGSNELDWQQFLAGCSTLAPSIELGSMRHPTLATRLFVS